MGRLNGTLGRTPVGTVQTSAPPATDRSSSTAWGEFRGGAGDVMKGRVTLIMLDTLILILIAFYLWTHRAQGGG